MSRFYSNGKLLLTGEYLVLDGATALALPTKLGQSLEVTPTEKKNLSWTSLDHNNTSWLEASFSLSNGRLELSAHSLAKEDLKDAKEAQRKLLEILQKAHALNPSALSKNTGFDILTRLDFDRSWGLGSSSTLINNIAHWFKVDPYLLLKETFGGSGYDIASANHNNPITFTLSEKGPRVFTAAFDPPFKDQLFFVHLNRKQNSRKAIAHYKSQNPTNITEAIEKVNSLTERMIACDSLHEFELLLEIHETLLSNILKTPKVKSELFPDYPRNIKSLGGWGGDFVLATGGEEEKEYFKNKGYTTIIEFEKMVL